MANGDDAVAAGMAKMTGAEDLRLGYDEINITRDYIAPLKSDTGWINATLGNSWTAVASEEPGYRRKGGIVYLRGRATGGTTNTAFTLPVGFRPAMNMRIAAISVTSATLCLVFIGPTGVVNLTTATGPNFAGIAFPADA